MCCGKALLAISDGHQNPKSPVTPPSHRPHAQSILRELQIPLVNGSSKPFPKKRGKAKAKPTKARLNKDKVECLKAFDRKASGLQSGDMNTATLPEESLPTHTQCFHSWK